MSTERADKCSVQLEEETPLLLSREKKRDAVVFLLFFLGSEASFVLKTASEKDRKRESEVWDGQKDGHGRQGRAKIKEHAWRERCAS